jgi:hypothetical protein
MKFQEPEAIEVGDRTAAERGTRIHAARETENTLNLSTDELQAYQSGLKLERGLVLDWAAEFGIESYAEGPREARWWLHNPVNLSPMLSGKLDVHYISNDGKRMLVADWKLAGENSVSPWVERISRG